MNPFTLLYLFYSAKLGSQATIYFIWLVDSTSGTIAFIAAAVAIFSIFPFFHLIVHVFSAEPLYKPAFIAYLCFRWAPNLHGRNPADTSSQLPIRNSMVQAHKGWGLCSSICRRHSLRSSRPPHLPIPVATRSLAQHPHLRRGARSKK
jgi:hypothetical protein